MTCFEFLFRYADILQKNYVCQAWDKLNIKTYISQSPGVPYQYSSLYDNFIHVSSAAHLGELGEAPESRLSLVALAEDVRICPQTHTLNALTSEPKLLQPKHTMNGFHVFEDSVTGTSLQYRVLRTLLTANLPNLSNGLQQKIGRACDTQVCSGMKTIDGGLDAPTTEEYS